MKKTLLTLKSSDHEALAHALKEIMTKTGEPSARVTLNKVAKTSTGRVYGVNIQFDIFSKELVEKLQKIDFTSNVEASFRDLK